MYINCHRALCVWFCWNDPTGRISLTIRGWDEEQWIRQRRPTKHKSFAQDLQWLKDSIQNTQNSVDCCQSQKQQGRQGCHNQHPLSWPTTGVRVLAMKEIRAREGGLFCLNNSHIPLPFPFTLNFAELIPYNIDHNTVGFAEHISVNICSSLTTHIFSPVDGEVDTTYLVEN